MIASATDSILDQLKARTRAYHNQIADNRYSRAIFAGKISPADYHDFLARFYGFYAPAEQALASLASWPDNGIDRSERAKLPLLARDLRHFGYTDEALAALPRCRDLPDLSSTPHALGCLYVFEGSTLGGQIILRQLRTSLSLTFEQGGAFFACYGEQTGPMWQQFGAGLSRYVASYGQADQIIDAACAVFEALDRWLKA